MNIEVKDVTCWYRYKNGDLEFNHIEFGHSALSKPRYNTMKQRQAWDKVEWIKKHAEMVDGVIVNEREVKFSS